MSRSGRRSSSARSSGSFVPPRQAASTLVTHGAPREARAPDLRDRAGRPSHRPARLAPCRPAGGRQPGVSGPERGAAYGPGLHPSDARGRRGGHALVLPREACGPELLGVLVRPVPRGSPRVPGGPREVGRPGRLHRSRRAGLRRRRAEVRREARRHLPERPRRLGLDARSLRHHGLPGDALARRRGRVVAFEPGQTDAEAIERNIQLALES